MVLAWSSTFPLVFRQNRERTHPWPMVQNLENMLNQRKEPPSRNKSISRVSFSSSYAIWFANLKLFSIYTRISYIPQTVGTL